MSTTTQPDDNILHRFSEAIDKAVEAEVQTLYEKHIKAFQEEAEKVRADVIARAVMRMSSWYNFENLGHTLRIEVKNPGNHDD